MTFITNNVLVIFITFFYVAKNQSSFSFTIGNFMKSIEIQSIKEFARRVVNRLPQNVNLKGGKARNCENEWSKYYFTLHAMFKKWKFISYSNCV